MGATTTYKYRKLMLNKFELDIDSASNYYYVGLGKSEEWSESDGNGSLIPDTADASIRNERLIRQSLQSIKSVTEHSFVATRNNWTNGTTYYAYDDADYNPAVCSVETVDPHYVVTELNQVYICVQQGRNSAGSAVASTVSPTGSTVEPIATADGYVWKFLYSIDSVTANKFLSGNFIPVPYIEDSAVSIAEIEQKGIQDSAVAGSIVAVEVTDGGSGYTSAPTVTVAGDGSGVQAIAFVDAGTVSKIEIRDSDGIGGTGLQIGSGYNEAAITFTGGGGTGATARAVFAPKAGLGADPRIDLRANGIMLNVKPSGDENGTFVIDNDFRQVALWRNPKKEQVADSDFTSNSGRVVGQLVIDIGTYTGTISADTIITQASTGAVAHVDFFDSDTIWYHQVEATGFIDFKPNLGITYSGGGATLEIDSATALIPGEVDKYSGEIIYFDNKAAIVRSDTSTEDVKIIIQF
jgi:hypothetical protein